MGHCRNCNQWEPGDFVFPHENSVRVVSSKTFGVTNGRVPIITRGVIEGSCFRRFYSLFLPLCYYMNDCCCVYRQSLQWKISSNIGTFMFRLLIITSQEDIL